MKLTALLLGASIAAPAAAQPSNVPLGSRLARSGDWETIEQQKAARVRSSFMECAYKKSPARVDALLAASDSMAWDEKKLGISPRRFNRAFGLEACLGRAGDEVETAPAIMLKMQFESFRSMMAEASYLAHNSLTAAWLDKMPSPVTRPAVAQGEDARLAIGKAMFADCLVAAVPRAADALLRTPAHSTSEKAAVKALVPFLGNCVPVGQTLSFSAENIRGFVADGLWAGWHTKQEVAE